MAANLTCRRNGSEEGHSNPAGGRAPWAARALLLALAGVLAIACGGWPPGGAPGGAAGGGVAGGAAATGPLGPSEANPLTFERLRNAAAEPGNWLTYSGQYDAQRFSRLEQITRANVDKLEVGWVHQIAGADGVETSPLVIDGMMFVTGPDSNVTALDAAEGRQFWTYEHLLPDKLTLCCGRNNRGVAALGDRLFVGTLDARLVALDARSGQVVWETKVADEKAGYSITGAPLVVKNMVITGIAGGEYGIRGFLDAYDAATGKLLWRFYTVPGPGEPGHESWEGDSWKTGGAPTWMTGSYDPDLNLIYWGTGNPAPNWYGGDREGDNLYSDAVIALDADTGKLRWHFQFTPHDVHDWDATSVPILADAEFGGKVRKLMYFGNRNGFFYVLDRGTGEFLLAKEFARQTWAERIDEKGRPVRLPGTFPTEEGVKVFPDMNGAANWWSPTYSPLTRLFYLTAYDGASTYYTGRDPYVPGQMFVGSSPDYDEPEEKFVSAIRAIDPSTGERRWELRLKPKSTSGLLATAGNLVFGGSRDGYFFALDAETGRVLWRWSVGGWVHAAPVSYIAGGRQHVAIAAGSAIFAFTLR